MKLFKVYERAEAFPTSELPEAVKKALRQWANGRKMAVVDVFKVIQRDNIMGCFCFWGDGVFYGVEDDGYIHT